MSVDYAKLQFCLLQMDNPDVQVSGGHWAAGHPAKKFIALRCISSQISSLKGCFGWLYPVGCGVPDSPREAVSPFRVSI